MPSRSASDFELLLCRPGPDHRDGPPTDELDRGAEQEVHPFSGISRPTNPMASPVWGVRWTPSGSGVPICGMVRWGSDGRPLERQPACELVDRDEPGGAAEGPVPAQRGEGAPGDRQALAGEEHVGHAEPPGGARDGRRAVAPRLFLHLDQLGPEVGEQAADGARVPERIGGSKGAASKRDGHRAHAAVVAPGGLLLLYETGRHPAIRHRGGHGHTKGGQSTELAPGQRVRVDAGDHECAHATNLAGPGPGPRGGRG